MENIYIDQLQSAMDQAVEEKIETGCQFAIYKDGQEIVNLVAGSKEHERKNKVTFDTLFPVYSVGKPIMATACLMMLEQNYFQLDEPICKYWKDFTGGGKEDVLFIHAFSHSTGLHRVTEQMDINEWGNWDKMCSAMEQASCQYPSGSKCEYHGITFSWVLGRAVELACKRNLKSIIKDELLSPLGLEKEIVFGWATCQQDEKRAHIDYLNSYEGEFTYIMEDDNFRKGFMPAANCMATARALAKFYDCLLNSKILKKETLSLATKLIRNSNQPLGDWANFGLGYALKPNDNLGRIFGQGGALGSHGFADKESGYSIGFTRNLITPNHPNYPLRDKLLTLVNLPTIFW
jgi:CubicO group peptidase (beta-lactamase class C family)